MWVRGQPLATWETESEISEQSSKLSPPPSTRQHRHSVNATRHLSPFSTICIVLLFPHSVHHTYDMIQSHQKSILTTLHELIIMIFLFVLMYCACVVGIDLWAWCLDLVVEVERELWERMQAVVIGATGACGKPLVSCLLQSKVKNHGAMFHIATHLLWACGLFVAVVSIERDPTAAI